MVIPPSPGAAGRVPGTALAAPAAVNAAKPAGRGRVVVVTGASAGIGRATAAEFARHGWRVALLARGADGLDGARRAVERAGGEALPIAIDVADADAVEAAAGRVEAEWGPIDVWVNDAMATIFAPALEVAPADFRRATEVTYLGAVWGTLAALRRMQPRDRGTIVQVGSALAYRSIPLQAPYCGAKSALRGFTDALRCELVHARSRVRLTMVQLSAFNTPQFTWGRTTLPWRPRPMGAIFQPELAARGIYFAATHARRELWVGWPAVQAILGQRLLPGLLDRMLGRNAWDGQHTDEPLPPGRRDNLYRPVDAETGSDHGAHGRFDALARTGSTQLWLSMHRGTMLLGGAAALALWALRRRARR
jgi:NAD(P)-dependent dehydrogenase (short-subunit alcohol dehydrogenase family)